MTLTLRVSGVGPLPARRFHLAIGIRINPTTKMVLNTACCITMVIWRGGMTRVAIKGFSYASYNLFHEWGSTWYLIPILRTFCPHGWPGNLNAARGKAEESDGLGISPQPEVKPRVVGEIGRCWGIIANKELFQWQMLQIVPKLY